MIAPGDVHEVIDAYFAAYSIRLNSEFMLSALESAKILWKVNGNYQFRYKYYYYYFVARYLADALKDPSESAAARLRLTDMVDRLYYEEYASILLFVVYFTRDTQLIQHIVDNANKIYRAHAPCDFENDVDFINRLYKEAPKMILPSSDAQDHRREHRQQLDEAERLLGSTERSEKIKYDESLEDIIKVNVALKTLQLMGQVLRNFPGSLRSELKIKITAASYLLGLRTLNALFGIARDNLEACRSYIAEIIKEYRTFDTERELAETTDRAIIWLTRRAAFGMIKRVSYAVGLEILEETYKGVLKQEGQKTSLQMIDLSVKLDHFSAFPESQIEEVWNKLRKNCFGGTVLRDLVANHLYLFPEDYRVRQRVGALLDIQTTEPKYLAGRSKKISPR